MGKRFEIDNVRKTLFSLEKKVIKLQKEVLKIIDEIYLIDEVFGEAVNNELQDEKFIRSIKWLKCS